MRYCILSISDQRISNIMNIVSIMGNPDNIKTFDISSTNDIDTFKFKYKNFDIDQYLLNKKYNTNPIRHDGEIGCWMSHFNAWNYVVENNIDEFFILEDDCFLTEARYDAICNDIISNKYDVYTAGRWAEMYYIKNSSAKFLIDNAFEEGFKKMPVDEFIFESVREYGLHGKIGANIVSQINQLNESQINFKVRAR